LKLQVCGICSVVFIPKEAANNEVKASTMLSASTKSNPHQSILRQAREGKSELASFGNPKDCSFLACKIQEIAAC